MEVLPAVDDQHGFPLGGTAVEAVPMVLAEGCSVPVQRRWGARRPEGVVR
jgi:hypothetical protein